MKGSCANSVPPSFTHFSAPSFAAERFLGTTSCRISTANPIQTISFCVGPIRSVTIPSSNLHGLFIRISGFEHSTTSHRHTKSSVMRPVTKRSLWSGFGEPCRLEQLIRGWPSDDNGNAAAMVDADSPVIEADKLARCYRDQEWWRREELNFR
jgi:hypothetical protein